MEVAQEENDSQPLLVPYFQTKLLVPLWGQGWDNPSTQRNNLSCNVQSEKGQDKEDKALSK